MTQRDNLDLRTAFATPEPPSTSAPGTTPCDTPGGDEPAEATSAPGIAGAGEDLAKVGAAVKNRAEAMWADLSQGGEQLVAGFRTAADNAYEEFKTTLSRAQLTPAEAEDVRWAFNAMAYVGVRSIEAQRDPQLAAALKQKRLDAMSVMADVTACKMHDGEQAIARLIARIFALAQDFVLRGTTMVVGAALG